MLGDGMRRGVARRPSRDEASPRAQSKGGLSEEAFVELFSRLVKPAPPPGLITSLFLKVRCLVLGARECDGEHAQRSATGVHKP